MKAIDVRKDVTRFIDEVAKRLPDEAELIQIDKAPIFGFELKLTGVKEEKGEKIDDDKIYELEVPVYRGIMIEHRDYTTSKRVSHIPTIRYTDHRHQLRNAYLAKGIHGVCSYLGKYMDETQVNNVRKFFIRANA